MLRKLSTSDPELSLGVESHVARFLVVIRLIVINAHNHFLSLYPKDFHQVYLYCIGIENFGTRPML